MRIINSDQTLFWQATATGIALTVQVVPRSSQSSIVGIHEQTLKIKIQKPPVDGQANKECCMVVAKHFGLPKSSVTVVKGHTSRRKVLHLDGVSADVFQQKLQYMH